MNNLKELKEFVDRIRVDVSLRDDDYMDNEEVVDILDDIILEIEKLL